MLSLLAVHPASLEAIAVAVGCRGVVGDGVVGSGGVAVAVVVVAVLLVVLLLSLLTKCS